MSLSPIKQSLVLISPKKMGEMIAIDCVVMERENLGKHIRGELEQLGLE